MTEQWWKLIEQGLRYKERFGWSKRWPVYRDYARGVFPGYQSSADGILPYNLVYAMLRTMVPSIYLRNPYVNITPRLRPGLEIHARILESIVNWLLQEIDIKAAIRRAVIDCFFTNRGIIKIGYDSLYGFTRDELLETLGLESLTFNYLDNKGRRIEYNTNVKPGMPWAIQVFPEFFIVPYGVQTLDDCPWVDHITIRPLEDVKADPKYKNTRDLQGTHIELLYRDVQKRDFYQSLTSEIDYVELHEIRDLKRGEIRVLVPGYDKWLREEEDELQIEGLPFVDFTFNEDTEFYWSASDVQIMEPQQLEMNEARTQAMKHRRLALVKFLAQRGAIDPDEIDKMLREDVGPVVFVDGAPSQAVNMLQPHIPPDLVQWVEVIRSDVREMMGVGKLQAGELSTGRKTATEAQIVHFAHQLRMDSRRDAVADALTKAVRKIIQLVFKMWDRRRVAEVVGYDAARYWVEFTGREIIGEYNVRVDVESMTPMTKAIKRSEILQVIQALSKYPGANISYLLRSLLREFEWADVMKILPPSQETLSRPMTVREFIARQNSLLQQPDRLKAGLERAGALIGAAL